MEILGVPVSTLAVQFGFRTSVLKTPLSRQTSEAILSAFRSEWPELIEGEQEQEDPSSLIHLRRKYYVGRATVDTSALIVKPDGITANILRVANGESVDSEAERDAWAKEVTKKAQQTFLQVQSNMHTGYSFHRAGKIFEIQLGPITKEQLPSLIQFATGRDVPLDELSLQFSKFTKGPRGRLMNLQHTFKIGLTPAGFYGFGLRLDVNNRQMVNQLDPHDVLQIWEFADSLVPEYLSEERIWGAE